jgi:hypothetical protein
VLADLFGHDFNAVLKQLHLLSRLLVAFFEFGAELVCKQVE